MSDEINLHIGERPELRWISIDLIGVDYNYQRELKPRVVEKILKKFSWTLFGCISLAEHADGKFMVFDGSHRLAAAQAHPTITEVPASVIRVAGMKEEAEAFLGVNTTRTAVNSVERYWAGLEAGDANLIRIRDVLARAGCEVVPAAGRPPKSSMTNSIAAIQRAIERYGDKAVVETLKSAWGGDRLALNGTMIRALARLYRGNPGMLQDRMISRLAMKSRQQLAADANAMLKIVGGMPETALSKTLVELYNRQLQSNQIGIGEK